jgi:hypothetical protein
MRRLILLSVLVALVAFMPSCGAKHFTKLYLANWTERPFLINGGDELDCGCSRVVLELKHGASADIRIVRGGITVTTIVAKSLVDAGNATDLEAGLRLYEPTTGTFEVVCDEPTLVSATLK